MVVTVILIVLPRPIRLRRVVTGAISRDQRAPLREVQINVALQADRVAQIPPRRQQYSSSAGSGSRFNRPVDSWGVYTLAIATCSKRGYVEDTRSRMPGWDLRCSSRRECEQTCQATRSPESIKKAAPAGYKFVHVALL